MCFKIIFEKNPMLAHWSLVFYLQEAICVMSTPQPRLKNNAPVDSSTQAPELFQIQSNILGRGLTAIKASTTWNKEMTRKMDISVFSTPNSWDFWKLFKNIRPHSRAIQMEDGKHSNLQMHQFIEEMSKAYFVSNTGWGCATSSCQGGSSLPPLACVLQHTPKTRRTCASERENDQVLILDKNQIS